MHWGQQARTSWWGGGRPARQQVVVLHMAWLAVDTPWRWPGCCPGAVAATSAMRLESQADNQWHAMAICYGPPAVLHIGWATLSALLVHPSPAQEPLAPLAEGRDLAGWCQVCGLMGPSQVPR